MSFLEELRAITQLTLHENEFKANRHEAAQNLDLIIRAEPHMGYIKDRLRAEANAGRWSMKITARNIIAMGDTPANVVILGVLYTLMRENFKTTYCARTGSLTVKWSM